MGQVSKLSAGSVGDRRLIEDRFCVDDLVHQVEGHAAVGRVVFGQGSTGPMNTAVSGRDVYVGVDERAGQGGLNLLGFD